MVSFKKFMTENMKIRELDSILESSNSSESIYSLDDNGELMLEHTIDDEDDGLSFDEDEFSELFSFCNKNGAQAIEKRRKVM
jgi:hypothetical protein